MVPSDASAAVDSIVNQITTTNSPPALQNYLRSLNPKETRETALASPLPSGQDPLSVLDLVNNTLGVLYILSARLSVTGAHPPSWQIIQDFCGSFSPEQARLAPDRITLLAKGIQRLALNNNNPRWAIQPLYELASRYSPDPSYLTTIHPVFVLTCLQASNPVAALPLLSHPITNISTNLSDLTYNDNLTFHYTGGVALAMLKRWNDAEEFFEICVSAPGSYPSALQMEALKKLRLVQLISKGKISSLPKYTHPLLIRQFKNTPYHSFISAYPHNVDLLRDIFGKDRNLFSSEKNLGLLHQAIQRAPRWALKKLTATYLSLNLADIGKAVKIDSEDEVRAVLLSMIESGDISATIAADGSVTFSDPPPQFTKAQVDQVLQDVQQQSALLEYLEKELGRSKDYLSKAVKSRDDNPTWAPTADEEMFASLGMGGQGVPGLWEETPFS